MLTDYNIAIPVPAADETVKVTTEKKKREPYPGYTMWGNGKATKFGGESMDVIDMFADLGKAELELTKFFRDEIHRNVINKAHNTHLIVPAKSDLCTSYLSTALKKHYKHMACLGIVRRVKRGTYMVNPRLLIPTRDVEMLTRMWDGLDDKKPDCPDDLSNTKNK